MNFLKQIKEDLNNPRNRHGMRDKVLVDVKSLRELIDNFESMDAEYRALHPDSRMLTINHQLHQMIEAAYQKQGKNAETTLMLIMDTLRPLMEEKHKELEAMHRFGG